MIGLVRNPERGRFLSGSVCPFCTGGHRGHHCGMIRRLPPDKMLSLCGSYFEVCNEFKTLKQLRVKH